MKKALLVLSIILFIFSESCSDDFNINDPSKEAVYVLNCILRNDRSIQYAIFSKNIYTENGAPPISNSLEQYIQGANLKIFNNNSVFVMRDTTFELTDSGSVNQVNCFYAKDLIIKPGNVYRIEASVSGEKKLESTIQVPYIHYDSFSPNFPQAYRTGYQERPYYSWNWYGNNGTLTNVLNLPQLEIYYQKYDGGIYIDKKIDVPLVFYYAYDEYNNLTPVKVELSFNDYCRTTLETLNKTMQEISGDDPNKKNYIINKVLFNIKCLDPELSKYYSAYNTYSNEFTIKLRQTDYSNIEGGKGIFGAYYEFSRPLTVDSLYVISFGYKYDPR